MYNFFKEAPNTNTFNPTFRLLYRDLMYFSKGPLGPHSVAVNFDPRGMLLLILSVQLMLQSVKGLPQLFMHIFSNVK